MTDAPWNDVRPHLDELLNRLNASERLILIQHYLEGRTFNEIGPVVNLTPSATQKRSVRALGKLSRLLKRRGAVISATSLAAGLGAESGRAVPLHLSGEICSAVLSAPVSSATISITALLTAMTTSKLAIASTFVLSALIPFGLSYTLPQSVLARGNDYLVPEVKSSQRVLVGFSEETFRTSLEKLTQAKDPQSSQIRRLRSQMFTLNEQDARTAIEVLDEFQETDRLRVIMQAAYARWAELDPEAATVDAGLCDQERWESSATSGAWLTWAFSDWVKARDWVSNLEAPSVMEQYLATQATRDGLLAVNHAKEISELLGESDTRYVEHALFHWAGKDPGDAIGWIAENYEPSTRRDKLIGKNLKHASHMHPEESLELMGFLSNPQQREHLKSQIFEGWAQRQPDQTIEYFQKHQGGEHWHIDTLENFSSALARNIPSRSLDLGEAINDQVRRDRFYSGIIKGAQESDFRFGLEAAARCSDEGVKNHPYFYHALKPIFEAHTEDFVSWKENLPESNTKYVAYLVITEKEREGR